MWTDALQVMGRRCFDPSVHILEFCPQKVMIALNHVMVAAYLLVKTKVYFQNGFLSSLPHISRFLGGQIFGFISVQIFKRKLLAPINSQKMMVCLTMLIPGAGSVANFKSAKWYFLKYLYPGMVWLSFTTDQKYICVAIMSVSFMFNGALFSGHSLNSLFIAPNR